MATRHRTREEAIAHARRVANAKQAAKQGAKVGASTPAAPAAPDAVKDEVVYIPSDEFQATAREIARRRAGLLKRLAE
jgi:hypothetical protein